MTPTPPTLTLIAEAAALRAGGATWDAVAKQVGRAPETVRKWPTLYPTAWAKAFARAEKALLADAAAESVIALRKQLRSDDEKSSRDAAAKLIQYRVAAGKSASGKPSGPKASAAAVRIAAHIETLADDQLDQLLDRVLPAVIARRESALPSPSPDCPD